MPEIIAISDPEDPRIAAYRDVRERDVVGRAGKFVAEGEVVLNALLGGRARHGVESLLIADKRLATLSPLLARVPEGVPVFGATQAVMDAVVGFAIHRGILAIGIQAPPLDAAAALAALGPRATVVALSAIANHDNLGGIFRNAAAFGADLVLLDSDCCDPLYRKAIRVSVGATLTVPTARCGTAAEMLGQLADHGFETIGLSPRGGAELRDYARPPRVAALFGAEGPGLAEAVLARTISLKIPMAPGFDSLNVATTTGIVLHHLGFG